MIDKAKGNQGGGKFLGENPISDLVDDAGEASNGFKFVKKHGKPAVGKGRNTVYRFEKNRKRDGDNLGYAIEVSGQRGFVTVEHRRLYALPSKRKGESRMHLNVYSASEACQLASILMHEAFNAQTDAEQPFRFITTKEKASSGNHALYEDYFTANQRMKNRQDREAITSLFVRFIECTNNDPALKCLSQFLMDWASAEGDYNAQILSDKVAALMNLIDPSKIN